MGMRENRWWVLGLVFGLLCGIAPALRADGTPQHDALFEARDRALAQLAVPLAERLPDRGHVGILPPEVGTAERVWEEGLVAWDSVLVGELHRRRGELKFTERTALETILREQKFGDSAYADPLTAVEVGRLAAAQTVVLTRIEELRAVGPLVRVHWVTKLLDVETGEVLWAQTYRRALLPAWAQIFLLVTVLLLGLLLAMLVQRIWQNHRLRRAAMGLPGARAEVRVDVDGLSHSLVRARERIYRSSPQQAPVLQQSMVELESELDRLRHGLPAGLADGFAPGGRKHDLRDALGATERMAKIVHRLRQSADSARDGDSLAQRLRTGADELRAAFDGYRQVLH